MIFQLDRSTDKIIGIAAMHVRIDATNCKELQKAFSLWLHDSANIVFDCSALDFIDSSGLGAIVSCLRKALEQKGDLKLTALGPKVSLIFELTKAKQLFSIYPDAASAVTSFNAVAAMQ
jgi:anti-sigma B factor antagonist